MNLSALASLLVIAGPGQTIKNPIQTKIQALYDEADSLTFRRDIPGLSKFLLKTRTPDFLFIAKSGKTPLPQLIQSMSLVMRTIDKVVTATVKVNKLTVQGTTATTNLSTVFVFISKKTSAEPKHVYSEQVIGEDTWIKSGESWKLKVSMTTTEHLFKDGRPLNTL